MANKFSFVSLGCAKNLVDSDNLTRRLLGSGFIYEDNFDDADLLLINTCGFIEDAKKESIEEILKLAKLKKVSRGHGVKGYSKKIIYSLETSKPRNLEPCPKLVVFGCLAKRYKDELIKEIPGIDAIFGVGEDEKIVEYCMEATRRHGDAETRRNKHSLTHPFTPSPLHPFSSYAYLKIAEGCSRKCAYCVIPSIRGEYKSASPDEILKNAERRVNSGIKELILIAQDTASYGKEFKGYGLSTLLKDLCSIKGDFWIRLLYAYPASITDRLLDVIAEEEKICKYLDIPFQHSEDRILKLMKRGGSRKGHLNLVRKIRSAIPNIALRTTFIVGFPTETEDEFNSMMDFIDEAQFDRLGAFKYSKEEGTPASKLKGHLPAAVKNRRIVRLMRHQENISFEKNRKLAGRRFKAIIDEINHGVVIGRLYSHAPEIDGVVIIDDCVLQNEELKIAHSPIHRFTDFPIGIGNFVTVEITDAFEYDLKGKVIE